MKTTHAHSVKFAARDDRCERLVSNLATGTHTCECQHPTKGSLGSPLIHRTVLHCDRGYVCFCRSNKCCLRADKKNIWRSALRRRQKTHDGCNHIWQETNSPPKLLLLPHDSFPSGTSEEIHLRFQRRCGDAVMRIILQNTCSRVGDEQGRHADQWVTCHPTLNPPFCNHPHLLCVCVPTPTPWWQNPPKMQS